MIIQYYGKQFFKISQGDTTLAFNPISKDSKSFNKTKFGSSIAFTTVNNPDYNGVDQVSHSSDPFIVSGPGEYEISETFVTGYETESKIDGKSYYNTVYKVLFEKMSIVFCGVVSEDLSPEIKSEISEPDVLFVPIDGNNGLTPAKAHKLATSLEAKMVIPMDFDKENLKQFLKESGSEDVKAVEKLTLKRSDFSDLKVSVNVLKAL